MEKKDEELIQTLLEREPELRRYYEEHVDLERQLGALPAEALPDARRRRCEKKRLQKLKLAGKDKIMEILSRYRDALSERMRHTISVLVENEFGVLARVAGPVQRPRLQHREPVGRRDARPDRVAHHAGHARRRPGARADREAAEQARSASSRSSTSPTPRTSSASSC